MLTKLSRVIHPDQFPLGASPAPSSHDATSEPSQPVSRRPSGPSRRPPTRLPSAGLSVEVGDVRLLRGCWACRHKDVRDGFESLGGVRVLYPLFAQFDLPVLRPIDGMGSGGLDRAVDPGLCVGLVGLLSRLLPVGYEWALQDCPFLASRLELLRPQHLSLALVDALSRLLATLVTRRVRAAVIDAAATHLLADLSLWAKAEAPVLARVLVTLRAQPPANLRRWITPQRLLDALSQQLAYPADLMSNDQLTGDTALPVLRTQVLELLYTLLAGEGVPLVDSEARAVMAYLTEAGREGSERGGCEVMHLLLCVTREAGVGGAFAAELLSSPGTVQVRPPVAIDHIVQDRELCLAMPPLTCLEL